jgi:hypothetical protein
MATVNKIDSNITELRFAEEASFDTLPGSPVWYPLEPNSYSDFGGSVTLLARNPISADRQRKKGVITDLDASGGFNTDLTQTNLQRLLQGFFYADLRTKGEFDSDSVTNVDGTAEEYELTATALSAAVAAGGTGYTDGDTLSTSGGTGTPATFTATVSGGVVTAVTLDTAGSYTVVPTDPVSTTGGTGTGCTLTVTWDTEGQFAAGDLLWAKDFAEAANNGLKTVTGTPDENTVPVSEDLVDEASPTGTISRVGYEFGTADLDVVVSGTFPTITSSAKDFTELGLIPGDWIFVGGDTATDQFANAVNNGFKRVLSVAANVLTLERATPRWSPRPGPDSTSGSSSAAC